MASQEAKSPKSLPKDGILSPRFRSAAAMAGWDEEALLHASLVVEDTPVRQSRHKKRPSHHHHMKSSNATSSNRKRRSKRQQADSMPAVVLCLDDEEETVKKDVGVKKEEVVVDVVADDGDQENKKKTKATGEEEEGVKADNDACDNKKGIPNMDRLREELSCAICLEICFEPSTTPCGHSFCKKCLKCAAAKCGKRCPKCRQLISNGRSCTVNTVLWNTIQLLFPEEIEARRITASLNIHSMDVQSTSPGAESYGIRVSSTRAIPRTTNFVTATQVSQAMRRDRSATGRRLSSTRTDDAELALRLQREEFMGVFTDTSEQPRPTLHTARANLRAMASRAYHIRTRGRY